MFDKILIANRGEIALRVIRACREMGIRSVAVHSTADADAMHVRMADESVCIGPPSGTKAICRSRPSSRPARSPARRRSIRAMAFLSENANFVQILEDHGLTFIGPSAEHIRIMGDKITAKDTMKRWACLVSPARTVGVTRWTRLWRFGEEFGYPVIVKATAGGGGRGMKLAKSADEMKNAFSTARSEAKAAFGNDEVYIEKYLVRRATSRFRCLAMARATPCIWASATARCSAGTRRCSKRPPAPRLMPKPAHGSARSAPMPSPTSTISAPAPSSFCTKTASSISSR